MLLAGVKRIDSTLEECLCKCARTCRELAGSDASTLLTRIKELSDRNDVLLELLGEKVRRCVADWVTDCEGLNVLTSLPHPCLDLARMLRLV